jgi:hypothetical protein
MNQVMKKLQSLATLLILSLSLISTSFLLMSFSDDDTPISVFANEKGSPSNLTIKELKAVVQGEKQRWPDGTRISLAFLKTTTPAGNATARKLLNMSGDQFNKYWLALVFQGKATAPMFFSSAQELDNYLSSTPGALGVVDASSQMKTRNITVDDKKSF